MRIEANNLQEAFKKAATELNCSVTELDIKIIQNPSSGFLGFFKKTAIIEAYRENKEKKDKEGSKNSSKFGKKHKKDRVENKEHSSENCSEHVENKKDSKNSQKSERSNDKKRNRNKKRNYENRDEKQDLNGNSAKSERKDELSKTTSANISDNAFKFDEAEQAHLYIEPSQEVEQKPKANKESCKNILDNSIIDTFNKSDFDDKFDDKEDKTSENKAKEQKPKAYIEKVLPEIRENLTNLLNASCFKIDRIEVSKFNDETILIELDGEDAALLIGKEGYRYKAISYLIYNWIGSKYNISVRLEIAEFLKNQEAAMDEYLKGIIERVNSSKKAKTKPLDGILVKIALEKLREQFPDKYVGIKSDGDKQFVVVNDFVKKHE